MLTKVFGALGSFVVLVMGVLVWLWWHSGTESAAPVSVIDPLPPGLSIAKTKNFDLEMATFTYTGRVAIVHTDESVTDPKGALISALRERGWVSFTEPGDLALPGKACVGIRNVTDAPLIRSESLESLAVPWAQRQMREDPNALVVAFPFCG